MVSLEAIIIVPFIRSALRLARKQSTVDNRKSVSIGIKGMQVPPKSTSLIQKDSLMSE